MGTFVLFALVFLPVGGGIYWLVRYSQESVGDDSPLQRPITYRYGPGDFLRWTNSPLLTCVCLLMLWPDWLLLTNLPSATSIWPYLLTIASLGLTGFLFYGLNKIFLIEEKLWLLLRGTSLVADPATKSLILRRNQQSVVLTSPNVAQIIHHITGGGRFHYYHYEFVDRTGRSVFFYDYGRGLPFAIETYFRGIPQKWVSHEYPFRHIPIQ